MWREMMAETGVDAALHVLMAGSFPPQSQGISRYCGQVASALSEYCTVSAVGFRRMYPRRLFPGHGAPLDPSARAPVGTHLHVAHTLDYRNPLTWLRAVRTADAGILHIQWWSLPLFPVFLSMAAVFRRRGKKVVVTVHNVEPHETSALFARATSIVCRQADAVLVHGETNRERFFTVYPQIPREKVHSIPMVLPEIARSPSAMEARSRLDLRADSQVIMFFGIIRPYKGLEVLLQAFAQVAQARADCILLIAGKPWSDMASLHEQLGGHEAAGKIRPHLEYIPETDVPVFLAAADLVVLPYVHFAAQSAVAALAIAAKVPVIVSDAGGLPEALGYDSAWIVPAGDSAALAARILDFFANHAGERAAFARRAEALQATASGARTAQAHLAIYRAL
jgi:glycosyltransferase involved in cell wall biosynthesis